MWLLKIYDSAGCLISGTKSSSLSRIRELADLAENQGNRTSISFRPLPELVAGRRLLDRVSAALEQSRGQNQSGNLPLNTP